MLQLAKQLDSREYFIRIVVAEVVGSVPSLLAFSHNIGEMVSKLRSSWPTDLGHVLEQDSDPTRNEYCDVIG